jgi:putative ABC transport system permease protein
MVSLAIVIAMTGVIASIFAGFMSYVDKSVSGADFVLLPEGLLLGGGNPGASADLIAEMRNTPGVKAVTALRIGKGTVDGMPVQVIGIDPAEYPKIASFEFSYGGTTDDIRTLDQPRTLIANGVYAAQKGIAPGDTLDLTTANGTKSYRAVAVGSDYLNAKLATVYVSQDSLAEDFGVEANAAVLAGAAPGADFSAVKRDLERLVRDYPQFALYDTKTFRQMQLDLFGQMIVGYYLLLAVLALPTFLALLNTLAISVLARTREIGMLRAVGSTRKQVRRMVLAESLLLASIGVVFGVLAGVVLGYALVEAMNAVGFRMPYFFPTGGIVAGVLIGFVFALLAAQLPARNAAKLDIVTALHYE